MILVSPCSRVYPRIQLAKIQKIWASGHIPLIRLRTVKTLIVLLKTRRAAIENKKRLKVFISRFEYFANVHVV